uniref:Fucolectin tachylectin-4 pentraxin-1 domain-containing protein n=1 Tax=Periophthalmus magnuspinnatus TaxID=409849 RepID=A0A3B4BFC0_9GOBI
IISEGYVQIISYLNVALAGKANQSSTMHELGVAQHAIDGNRDPIYPHLSCTHTDLSTNPWWRVDLQKPYYVTFITITNRKDCCAQRLDGAEIRVGNSLDNNGNNNPLVATISHIPSGVSKTFKVTGAVEGRYVNVFLPGADKYLTLCEVEVYGYQQEGWI